MGNKTDVTLVARFIEELAKATDDFTMPSQQQLLLLALYTHGELPQIDLYKYTGVQKSSNSRNIARLGNGEGLTRGPQWVESYEDPMNRRSKMVRLTPKGRALIEAVASATHNRK